MTVKGLSTQIKFLINKINDTFSTVVILALNVFLKKS